MPYDSYGCSRCGQQAPKALRADGMYEERMEWLRKHYKANHPIVMKRWYKRGK